MINQKRIIKLSLLHAAQFTVYLNNHKSLFYLYKRPRHKSVIEG